MAKPITSMGHIEAYRPQLAIVYAMVAVIEAQIEPDFAFSEAVYAHVETVNASFVESSLIPLALESFSAN
jgi:hypothetical protein